MVFEKTARKREEAAANAAIQATKPAFEKVSHGLESLQKFMDDKQRATEAWEETMDSRQEVTRRRMLTFYDEIETINSEMDRDRQAHKIEEEIANSRLDALEHTSLIRCQCGALLSSLQMVCHECGAIRTDFPYNLKKFDWEFDVQAHCMEALIPLARKIQNSTEISEEYAYKDDLKDEIFTMEQIAAVSQVYMDNHQGVDGTIYKRVNQKAKEFLSECKSAAIEIAVAGNVKAGKSSLINALLGGKMASVDATPETSVLVKYRTTEDKNYIKARFYTELQWKRLWETVKENSVFQRDYSQVGAEGVKQRFLGARPIYQECTTEELHDAILKWTSSRSPEHFFVRELEVGYQGKAFPHDVMLVDTPGLRDPVKYRSDITRRYIKNSDWVLACISNENLSSQDEIDFLTKIIANKGNRTERVLIIATKEDMLPREDCVKKQELFLHQIEPLYGRKELAASHFISTSAELHSLLGEYLDGQITVDGTKKLKKILIELDIDNLMDIPKQKDAILQFAGINALFDRIDHLVLRARRKALLTELKEKYQSTLQNIQSQVTASSLNVGTSLLKLLSDSLNIKKETEETLEALQTLEETKQVLQKLIGALRKQLEVRYEEGEV